jgi:dCMP deaminase
MLMRSAYGAAINSDDRVTKNGAAIINSGGDVLVRGWNHFVDGWGDDEAHHERPFKYSVTEHAERDVIYKAANVGVACQGKTMIANWVACPECARAIKLAGIKLVICHKECMDRTPDRWAEMVALGLSILKKGGVELVQWSGKVDRVQNLNNGEIWEP